MLEAIQDAIDFVMANRAFFAFLAALAGYIIAKIKGAKKDELIDRQEGALEGVARAVEEFQGRLNRQDPLATSDPRALKKTVGHRVSKGREELDRAISNLRHVRREEQTPSSLASAAKALARAVLP